MSYESDQLEEERQSILSRLFKTKGYGRVTDPDEQEDIHRLGTIARLLKRLREE